MRNLLIILLLPFLFSCNFLEERIRGNGNIITQDMNFRDFENIRAGGALNVQVRQDNEYGVSLTTDENLMEYMDLHMDGRTLVIRERDGFNLKPSKDIIIYISAPAFRKIALSGSGNIVGENTISGNNSLSVSVSGSGNIDMKLDLPEVDARVSGSGSVKFSGMASKIDIRTSGSGDVHCFDLEADQVSLDLSGSASAEVHASRKLDVRVSGSADVKYKGNPEVSQRISGSGSVKKLG